MPPIEYRFDDLDLRVEPQRYLAKQMDYPTYKCPVTDTCTNTDACSEGPCTTSC